MNLGVSGQMGPAGGQGVRESWGGEKVRQQQSIMGGTLDMDSASPSATN